MLDVPALSRGPSGPAISSSGGTDVRCSAAWMLFGDSLMSPPGPGSVTAPAPADPSGVPPVSADTSSSGAPMTPISCPTGAAESSGRRRARSTPSPRATISMTALSVSTSASVSPVLTASPSVLSHFTRRPSSIVGERASIITFVAMG
jgi:hypothetical protein